MHLKLAVLASFPARMPTCFRQAKLANILAVTAICLMLMITGCAPTKARDTTATATNTVATAATEPNVIISTEQPDPIETPVPESVPTSKPAPRFSAPDQKGTLVALDDILRANQYTVVLFYRGFF